MKLGAAYQESEGALTLADPNGYKLMASRKRLDEALKECYGAIQGDEARAALDLLIELSDKRNQLVLDYNGLRGQITEIKSQIAEAKQQQASVAAQLQQNSRPDLPEFTAWVGDLYDKARSSVIEQVIRRGAPSDGGAFPSIELPIRLWTSADSLRSSSSFMATHTRSRTEHEMTRRKSGRAADCIPPDSRFDEPRIEQSHVSLLVRV